MKYKKFILFQYESYYPSGGLSDIADSFDTIEEAKAAVAKKPRDFNEIVDRDTWEMVWQQY